MIRDAFPDPRTEFPMSMRVHAFGDKNRVGERFYIKRRITLQLLSILGRQTKPKSNTKLVQQCLDLR
jgi:hypothetical protein